MKKIGVFTAALFAVSITVNAAQIFEAAATSITGTDYATHYGNNYAKGGWKDTPVTLDLTSPHIEKNAVRNATTYGAPSVFVALSMEASSSSGNFRGGGFGVSNQGGSGWRVRMNNNGTQPNGWTVGKSFSSLNFFQLEEGDGTTASFTSGNDAIYLEGRVSTPSGADDSEWRIVVQDNDNFYISDAYISSDTTPEFETTINALSVNWYAYDPTVAPQTNGFVDIGALASPAFDSITGFGVHQQFKDGSDSGGYNHGFRTLRVQGEINGLEGPWAATNSVSWNNNGNTNNPIKFNSSKAFDFSTDSHFGQVMVDGIANTPIYGASYSDPRYVFADSAFTNATGVFDWRFGENSSGGLGMRIGRQGGYSSSTTNATGVITAHGLYMFPVAGFGANDADISLQTWSNQGNTSNGVNSTDGEIRFVVAKNYSGGTNWAISSPITHSVGTNQYNTVDTSVTYQGLDWFNYDPSNSWSVDNIGTQVQYPLPGDAILAGFKLSFAGVDTNNSQAIVFGARSFEFDEREWYEWQNDNIVLDIDPVDDWSGTGGNGVQWELGSIAFDTNNALIKAGAIIGAGLYGAAETNWWNDAPVYVGFKADGTYPAPVEGYAYTNNLASNYNSLAFSASATESGDGFKIQWNGPWQSGVGSIPGLENENGRFEAGDKGTALLFWKSEDFLGVSDGSTIEMTAANDSLQATVSYMDRDVVLSSGNVRFVIKENDQYYISPVVSNFTDEADNALLVAQATTASWFPYDPHVDIAAVDTSDPSTLASLSFTDIQGVGVWIDATVNTNTGFRLYPRIGLDSFKVGALVNTPSAADVKQAWFDLYSSGMGTNTADTADADGDGVKNIIEYAFGGDPTNPDSTGNQPSHGVVDSAGSNVLEVVYFERSDAASRGLATSLKESDNLVFTDFADATSVIVVGSGPSTNAGFNAVTNHISIDGGVKFISIDVNYTGE